MPKGKAPAFQFYPTDWLSAQEVGLMTPEQEGAYIHLIAYDWEGDGLPDDDLALAQLSRLGSKWMAEASKVIREKFVPHPNKPGFITHKRLIKERIKQDEFRKERSTSGLRGAKKRWLSHSSAIGSAIKQPIAKNGSVPSSSSSSSNSTPLPPAQPVQLRVQNDAERVGFNHSLDLKLNDSKLFDRTMALRAKVNSMFNRKDSDRWDHLEEEALCEAARRDDCLAEFQELARFRPVRGRFFPQSVIALLEKWTQTLDAARNGHILMDPPEMRLRAIRSVIETHPANKESIKYNPQHTAAEGDDYKQLRRDEREITGIIARQGRQAANSQLARA